MRFLTPFLILALAACASSPEREARPATQTVRIVDGSGRVTQLALDAARPGSSFSVELSVDQVWRALPSVYEALGIPIADMDANARMIGNRNLQVRRRLGNTRLSQYLDCGRTQGGPSADTYEVQLSVVTRVQQHESESSAVHTTLEARAAPVNFAAAPVRCASTGSLERRIAEELDARAVQRGET